MSTGFHEMSQSTADPAYPNPVSNNPNPVSNNPNPVSNNPHPVPNNLTPVRNNPNPVPNNLTPVSNNPHPVPNNLTPVPNNPNPVPDNLTPVPNNPNPVPNNPDRLSSNPNPVHSSFDEFRNEPEVSDPLSFDLPQKSEYVGLPEDEAHNPLVHSANESNATMEEPVTSSTEFPASPTTLENSTRVTSTNEQDPVENIPTSRIAEQAWNPEEPSSSIANECQLQTQTYVQPSVAENESFCDTKKDIRLSLPNDRQRNNHQTQGDMPQIIKRPVCMEMYYRLRSIFPNTDPDYIKEQCPSEWGPGDRDEQLIPLIDDLLEHVASTERLLHHLPATTVKTKFENYTVETFNDIDGTYEPFDDINGMYETLLGIFPDADPHYLHEIVENEVGKPNSLEEFVDNKLRSHDYPTREQYMTRLKITEQQKQYTTGFDVKEFLTIIPDPFKYFLDPKRKCSYNTVAFEFLKSYFSKIGAQTILSIYAQSKYNTSITAANLEDMGCALTATRKNYEMPTEDIVLLQEIAFVKHKQELSDHMLKEKTLEETEFRMLKEQNGLVECQCCFDSDCVPSKCSDCENGHRFCNSCVEKGTSSKMGDGETRITCFLNCGSEFSLSTLQNVLAPTIFSILLKKRQAAEVIEAGLEGLVSCPFCHFASIPPEEDKVFKCLNPECTKESCRLCKKLSHIPLRCDEVMEPDKARRYIEEKMTQALARQCHKCRRAFFKEEGCNKITCPCGACICYLCDKPLEEEGYKHFRGQGSEDKNLCPLYSDTIRLDAVAVHKVAERAQAEIMKIDPNIKIDTTKLLPTIPCSTTGPHTAVVNADDLPLRVQRVRYDPL